MVRRCVLFVVVALMLGSGVGFAQSNNCGVVGTWMHSGDTIWLATNTPGTSATAGQMDIEWITLDPTLGVGLPAVRASNPKGVWEKVNQHEYRITWVAYGLGANGLPVYVMRGIAMAAMTGCDRADLTAVLEVFGPDQDIWRERPLFAVPMSESATRMPLVVVK